MLCPVCEAPHRAGWRYCRRCGADMTISSTAVVPVKPTLPALPQRPSRALSPAAAGAGIVALGVGYELLRWGLRLWLKRPVGRALPVLSTLPTLGNLFNLHAGTKQKQRLPKGYQITETVVYMRRVIGPKD
jgi:hypothetical protein